MILQRRLVPALKGPHWLAFAPAAALAAFWLGGEGLLLLVALCLPALLAVSSLGPGAQQAAASRPAPVSAQELLERALDTGPADNGAGASKSGCFLIEIDDFDALLDRHGQAAADDVAERLLARFQSVLRAPDTVVMLDTHRFGIALSPVRHLDLGAALALCGRLQAAAEEPVTLDGAALYISVSLGFCLSGQLPSPDGRALIEAASTALDSARHEAPAAVRAFSPGSEARTVAGPPEITEAGRALENGQIQPWFQPQVSTDTGQLTGFEALARWVHPERGVIAPSAFLPILERSGGLERLGDVMLFNALQALKDWDAAGFDIPRVGINLAAGELHNPRLVTKVEWELDRFDLAPGRLAVEILETVVATSPDDVVARNIAGLARLGCGIDLDDFGTGHSSISAIRRFAVQRLKIDRSFVMKVDRDGEQQRMVSAILVMAERLGLDTLAEGVETAGEHAMLAQLGCGHVQGFGIARPMPADQTADWIRAHDATISAPPRIGRDAR
ncbi:putative bifunctional diguanylate cyclase/phosphodiesterase [Roseovarius salinarum]|uniref:putative bifunctional diguanylate cyclase/phosphodiesterase n=1 Tax=Roseovarius salinarum TaxID=1981892 RepID=UPI001E4F6E7E|nr:bifunctional diguanylate cyclase/phosphodiesterase [Roseovarius salinarum]